MSRLIYRDLLKDPSTAETVAASGTFYSRIDHLLDPTYLEIVVVFTGSGTVSIDLEDSYQSPPADDGFQARQVAQKTSLAAGTHRITFNVWDQAANSAMAVQNLQPYIRVKIEETGGVNPVTVTKILAGHRIK